MPVFFKPGYQMKIRVLKSNATDEVTLVGFHTPEIIKVSLCRLKLKPGDQIELEVPRWGEALCIFRAKVLEVDANENPTLKLLGAPRLLQRRKSRRIPVCQEAEYILLTEGEAGHIFHYGLLLNISRDGALLAVKEPLTLGREIFLIFEVNLCVLPEEKAIPTGMGGRVVRKHLPAAKYAEEWSHGYGLSFSKPFVALNS